MDHHNRVNVNMECQDDKVSKLKINITDRL